MFGAMFGAIEESTRKVTDSSCEGNGVGITVGEGMFRTSAKACDSYRLSHSDYYSYRYRFYGSWYDCTSSKCHDFTDIKDIVTR